MIIDKMTIGIGIGIETEINNKVRNQSISLPCRIYTGNFILINSLWIFRREILMMFKLKIIISNIKINLIRNKIVHFSITIKMNPGSKNNMIPILFSNTAMKNLMMPEKMLSYSLKCIQMTNFKILIFRSRTRNSPPSN